MEQTVVEVTYSFIRVRDRSYLTVRQCSELCSQTAVSVLQNRGIRGLREVKILILAQGGWTFPDWKENIDLPIVSIYTVLHCVD